LHALRFSGNDYVLQFLCCAFANDGGNGCVGDQNFIDGNATWPVSPFQKQLSYNTAK